ncbi:hypothetical protein NQ317_012639 [Molorchus minor]|uniref:Gustatory receptor n=1 Tax=Molorchus minor TaxID=1323400 RepID=A0ABQ9IR13_9CUCU|nr:hypothetical protein NQ317_012639 [Molorchus minor]
MYVHYSKKSLSNQPILDDNPDKYYCIVFTRPYAIIIMESLIHYLISIYFISILLMLWVWNSDGKWVTLYYTNYRIVKYCLLCTVILINMTTNMLKMRYKCLDCKIRKLFERTTLTKNNQKQIKEIKQLYRLLYNVVVSFNVIFGKSIFFITAFVVIKLLNCCCWILYNYNENTDTLTKHLISITAIVMGCDRVEPSSKKNLKTYYLLQETVEISPQRNDIFFLPNYMKELAPKFSAFGFFDVNQRFLTGLFSTVTSYVIIIIQLRN